ncbi:cupin domain-containing protein [Croceibacterium ferulae]|uniref:cupin domain-containing protein n=1 Tax=Croceibacterium ferulae TaxID=1854641 RepID=UPI000EAC8446|nr:cupin domain-containing protein [Croceibacterium ferulae]
MDPARFDRDAFLRDHWQQQPQLIRNPWVGWTNPLEPDELAGLACESEVESRLVTGSAGSWQMEQGPLQESRFAGLDAAPWTLLVQAVDQHVPEVTALLDAFRFIPNWRVDDVMVSYATKGGGVGPHFDQYDVFLIQGAGRRRWQLGKRCDDSSPLLPHGDLRLLAEFDVQQEWVLEPGDILYIPPGIAHDGVALDNDCMTYSIGFRAPSRAELVEGWTEHLLDALTEDDRYADPALPQQDNPGEITPAALARLHAMATEGLLDMDGFARWFGQHSTRPKYPEIDWRPDQPIGQDDLAEMLASGDLVRNPAARFSFVRQGNAALLLFVNGRSIPCDGPAAALAERICARDRLEVEPASIADPPSAELLLSLINEGAIAFDG